MYKTKISESFTFLYNIFKLTQENDFNMQQLLEQIQQLHALSANSRQAIADCFAQTVFKKNEMLLTEGQVCKKLYFIEAGALRGYYHAEGKEITHWFGFENDFVTSFHSFITGHPAVENIQFLEGSIVWHISKETLQKLLNEFHEIERVLRIAYEKYYIRLEERFVNVYFSSAPERYQKLLQESPHIIDRIQLGYIASYLGITQETLSRIRNKY